MNLKEFQKNHNLSGLELYNQKTAGHTVSFVANKLKHAESSYRQGLAVRLIKNKKIGFVTNYGNTDLDKMLLKGIELSSFSETTDIELPGKSEAAIKTNETHENNMIAKFTEKGQSIISSILKEAPKVLADVSFDLSKITTNLENSNDLNYTDSKNLFSLSINIRETLENDFIEIYTAIVDNSLPEYNAHLQRSLDFYNLSKKHVKIKNGSWPVLFTSKASKELSGIIEEALNGKQVIEKSSPWHDMLGKKVLSKTISLKQDPAFGYMSRTHDDEGNIIKPLILIENGILENFYFDLLTARRLGPGTQPSGNGFKPSLSSQPEPILLNMIVSPQKRSLDDIIKDIDYGLLVDQTIGGLSSNISGDMSVNIDLGFLIEKGKITGRVKDTMISGNIYNALNNVIELSNKQEWHWSNIYSPDLLVSGFVITTKNS